MRYVGDIYRPPSEAYSLLVQGDHRCSHNKCTFCNMFKEKQFKVRRPEEVLEDLAWARAHYPRVEKMFLCDGDALCLALNKLTVILQYIRDHFPETKRVTMYGRASDVLRKTPEELSVLRELGVSMVYLGAESGSDKVLKSSTRRDSGGADRCRAEAGGGRDSGFGDLYQRSGRPGAVGRACGGNGQDDHGDERLLRQPADADAATAGSAVL